MNIKDHFLAAHKVLGEFIADPQNMERIAMAGELMVDSINANGKIMSCGNGGSMCDAMHFAEELTGRYKDNRKPIAAISISDVSHMSCVGNDYGYDEVFARYVEALGRKEDVLLAISTSGNSTNVLKAVQVARSKGIKIVALTGKDGGQLASLADVEVRAPYSQYADRAQEIHIKVIHSLIDFMEQKLGLS